MKTKRQKKILDVISTNEIETQEELVACLQEAGYQVTQATISRDIKELKLIKAQSASGVSKYTVGKDPTSPSADVFLRILRDAVQSIEYAGNIVVIKTLTGSASAAAEGVDNLGYEGILGTIAGDNTIFIATASAEVSKHIVERFSDILGK